MRLAGELLPTLVGILVLMLVAVAALSVAGGPDRFGPARALLRAAVQLAAISLVLAGVIRDPVWVAVALLVIFGVASGTCARRLGGAARTGTALAAIAGGTVVALVVVFGSGAILLSPRNALAVGGIVIGNAMAITTVSGRRFRESVAERWEEVEGWLALGATPRQSTRDLARRAVRTALVPTIDQTRTTGLVKLPGAFVGAVFGGASPLEAGRFQLVVLAAILAAGAVAAMVAVRLLGAVDRWPAASEDR